MQVDSLTLEHLTVGDDAFSSAGCVIVFLVAAERAGVVVDIDLHFESPEVLHVVEPHHVVDIVSRVVGHHLDGTQSVGILIDQVAALVNHVHLNIPQSGHLLYISSARLLVSLRIAAREAEGAYQGHHQQ